MYSKIKPLFFILIFSALLMTQLFSKCVIEESVETQREYLLPDDSSLLEPLAHIFSDPNVLKNPKRFRNAGFHVISERPSGMFVASHPLLPGHLIKAYIESKKIKPNWKWAVYRCLGVKLIRELIERKNLDNFVVPNKWIYPLTPFEDNGGDLIDYTSPIVLVVTDMQLVPKNESKEAWRNASKKVIKELYCILGRGYSSCLLGSNIPYTIYGKFACIDTENPQRVLPLHHVGRHLSNEMEDYWEHLVWSKGMLF